MSDTKPVFDAEIVEPKQNALAVSEPSRGTLAVRSPSETISEAVTIADALADIILRRELYVTIQKKKYVTCEGWTTLGAVLGVIPIEEYCKALPDGAGFESKINLIRMNDGRMVGSASAECTRGEPTWASRNSHALRSMSLTRATSKAFRLSFSWIMKLAGFEPTPAEEMIAADAGGTKEDAENVAKRKIAEHEAKKSATSSPAASNSQQTASTEAEEAVLEDYRAPDGKRKFALVRWKGQEHSVWDTKLHEGLSSLKGKPVILYTAPSADKKYSNVLSYELPALQQSER